MRFVSLILSIAFLVPASAFASSSHWADGKGAMLRLVTTGAPAGDGTLKGALEIALKPGWKTYWRDPGDSGIPPQISVSQSRNVETAVFSFPAPQRVGESYGAWAGYTKPVTLPVTFTLEGPVDRIAADVFLGVCEQICIPVQVSLSLDPNIAAESVEDRSIVEAAFASLPAEARSGFRIRAAHRSGQTLHVEAEIPPDSSAPHLFVVSADGYLLGVPELSASGDGVASFTIELIEAPRGDQPPPAIDYTLVAGGHAVSGSFRPQDQISQD